MTEEQIAILSDPEFVGTIRRASIPRAIGEVIKRVNRRSFGEGVFLYRYYNDWGTLTPAGVRMATRGGSTFAVVQFRDTMAGSRWVAEAADRRIGGSAVGVGTFDNLCDALLASWGVIALTFPSEQ